MSKNPLLISSEANACMCKVCGLWCCRQICSTFEYHAVFNIFIRTHPCVVEKCQHLHFIEGKLRHKEIKTSNLKGIDSVGVRYLNKFECYSFKYFSKVICWKNKGLTLCLPNSRRGLNQSLDDPYPHSNLLHPPLP